MKDKVLDKIHKSQLRDKLSISGRASGGIKAVRIRESLIQLLKCKNNFVTINKQRRNKFCICCGIPELNIYKHCNLLLLNNK